MAEPLSQAARDGCPCAGCAAIRENAELRAQVARLETAQHDLVACLANYRKDHDLSVSEETGCVCYSCGRTRGSVKRALAAAQQDGGASE